MNNEVLMSSARTDWQTPREIFDHLDAIYHFNLDPASTKENALCFDYFTPEMNGLTLSWENHRVFVNPPYGREHNKAWAEKIFREGNRTLVVALVAARTGSAWFQNCFTSANHLYFLRGRVKFVGAESGATFDSCIAVWDQSGSREIKFCKWSDI